MSDNRLRLDGLLDAFERYQRTVNLDHPRFDEFDALPLIKKADDWRLYVPAVVRAAWDGLPILSRMAVFLTAEESRAMESDEEDEPFSDGIDYK